MHFSFAHINLKMHEMKHLISADAEMGIYTENALAVREQVGI
jgi:hypothetical protein